MIRPARTHRATKPTEATREALAGPTGALPGGAALRASRSPRKPSREAAGFGPVVIKQPPAGPWACDSCPTTGRGGLELLAHSRTSGHRMMSLR